MTTLSPTVAPDVFIASTFISSPLARVLHELFAAHDSQALLFIVVTHAVVEFTFVTIPSSVAKILTHFIYFWSSNLFGIGVLEKNFIENAN